MQRILAAVAASVICHRIAVTLAGAAMLVLGAPAAAVAAEPPARIQTVDAQAAAIQEWLGQSAAWSGPFTTLVSQRTDRLMALFEGGAQVVAHLDAGKRREARAWAERWAAEQRAGFAAEYDAFSALPATPPPLPPSIAADPSMREGAAALPLLRDRSGTMLRQTQASGETYIALVVAAASGRAADLAALEGGAFAVMLAHLEAETLMLQSTQGPVGEPNYYFSAAMIEANGVTQAWLELNNAIVTGRPVDRAGAVRRMRDHATLAREAADDLTLTTTRTRQMVENEPDIRATPLYAAMTPVFDSLLRSADIERELADLNMALAAATEANDASAQALAGAKIEAVIERRAAEFHRRVGLLAAMQ